MLLQWLAVGLILPCAVCKDGLRTLCPTYATSSCRPEEAEAAATDGAYYWNQQKGGASRTGYSPFPVTVDLAKGPAWQWRDPHNETIRTSPLIDDKLNMYLTTLGGHIYKLSQDGRILWTYQAPGESFPGVSALLDGQLFVSTRSGHVFSVDMEKGSEVWKVRISQETGADGVSIFAFNKTLILATLLPRPVIPHVLNGGNSKVVALNAHDGSLKWMFHPDTHVQHFQASSPGDGSVIFQDKSGGLYRLSIDDGRLIWRSGFLKRQWASSAASVVDDGVVFSLYNMQVKAVPLDLGQLTAHRLDNGQYLYGHMIFHTANQAPAVGKLGKGDKRSVVAALGDPIFWNAMYRYIGFGYHWSVALGAYLISMVAPKSWFPYGQRVAIVAFDAETGASQWRYELEVPPHEADPTANTWACQHSPCSQPIIGGDGTVYVACGAGKVWGIRDANGDGFINPATEVSSFDAGDGWQGSLAMAPGLLAVASCGGSLHVFKS